MVMCMTICDQPNLLHVFKRFRKQQQLTIMAMIMTTSNNAPVMDSAKFEPVKLKGKNVICRYEKRSLPIEMGMILIETF